MCERGWPNWKDLLKGGEIEEELIEEYVEKLSALTVEGVSSTVWYDRHNRRYFNFRLLMASKKINHDVHVRSLYDEILKLGIDKVKNIVTHGLPPPSTRVNEIPFATSESERVSVRAKEKMFGLVDDLYLHSAGCGLTWKNTITIPYEWATERDLGSLVELVIGDVVARLDFPWEVKLEKMDSYFISKRDEWMIVRLVSKYDTRGAFVVKSPYENLLRDENIVEVFRCLMMLKTPHYGSQPHPLAILTNYVDWIVCWLPESDEFVADRRGEGNCSESPTLDWRPPIPNFAAEECRMSYAKFKWNDDDIVRVLASAVQKMLIFQECFTKRGGEEKLKKDGGRYVCLTDASYSWEHVYWTNDFNPAKMPEPDDRLYVLCDAGGDRDSRVYVARTLSGAACVIKFPAVRSVDEELENEIAYWNLINGRVLRKNKLLVRKCRCNGEDCVVMPYVSPLDRSRMNESAIENAGLLVANLVNLNVFQENPKEEHIGVIGSDVVLLDFGDMAKIDGRADKSYWIQQLCNVFELPEACVEAAKKYLL